MKKELTKRQKAIKKRRIFLSLCALFLVAVTALTVFLVSTVIKAINGGDEDRDKNNSSSQITSSEESKEPKIISSATVINTGDILIHNPILAGAEKGDGTRLI